MPVRLPRFRFLLIPAGILFVGYGCWQNLTYLDEGENLSRVSWLPETATDISFYRSYRFTAYEFDISQTDFEKWNSDAGRKLSPITAPFAVPRYSFREAAKMAQSFPQTGKFEKRKRLIDAQQQVAAATITDGLCFAIEFGERVPNGGGVKVAWDRATGRAYYWSAPR